MAEDRMALLETIRKAAGDGDLDFLREGVKVLAQAVMEAEVTELTGVAHGVRDPEHRLTQRNGYRERRWDTRVGSIGLAVPRVRDGSYFPSLLEPRRRAERAMLAVVQEAYVAGVSTRRVLMSVRFPLFQMPPVPYSGSSPPSFPAISESRINIVPPLAIPPAQFGPRVSFTWECLMTMVPPLMMPPTLYPWLR